MGELKATPGPWEWVGNDIETPLRIVMSSRVKCGAFCYGGDVVLDITNPADAHLIAAAPELYAALEEAIDCGMVPTSSAIDGGASAHSRQVRAADQIRAAMAKARGEQ